MDDAAGVGVMQCVTELDGEQLDPIPEPLRPMVSEIAKYLTSEPLKIEKYLRKRDGAFRLASLLPEWVAARDAGSRTPEQLGWELIGQFYMCQNRNHEAISIFESLYRQMQKHQGETGEQVSKGMPLVWMSDCFSRLGYPVHAKRYLMLTLCEDSIRDEGKINPQDGPYFRLVWHFGLSPELVERYARKCWEFYRADPSAVYP